MEYRGKLEALLPAKQTYFGQYILLCLVKLATLLLGLNALIRLIAAMLSFSPGLWLAFNLAATALAAAYFYIGRPGELQFARWLDEKLNSRERLQTLFELEQETPRKRSAPGKTARRKKGDPGTPAKTCYRIQTSPEMRAWFLEETGRYLAAHPPAVTIDRRLFRHRLTGLFAALMVCAAIFYIAPTLSEWVTRGQELKSARQKAEQEIAELEGLLSGEPLLEELLAELATIKEQLAESLGPEEVALSLQEARELLAEYAEKLDQAEEAFKLPEELISANSAAEIASALQEDPRFNRQLLESLQGLQNRLFQLSSAGALELKGELEKIEKALEEGTVSDEDIRDLLALMEQLDPASAEAAVQSGLKQLTGGSGGGSFPAGSGGSGKDSNNHSDSTGSAAGNNSQEPGAGQGKGGPGDGEGQGSPGESPGNSGNSGQSGSGASGEGAGQQGGGAGKNSGSGSSSGEGQGGGTGSGALSEQQYYFIPGDQQVNLAGAGEEGSYTWQELIKYNPGLVPENLSSYYDSYYRQGISSINRGQVPQPLENYLRTYFQAITPP